MRKSKAVHILGRARVNHHLVLLALTAALFLGSTCSLFNKPPTTPVISGPSAGIVGVPVEFTATATDPDGDSIAFQFAWGDGDTSNWSDLAASGEGMSSSHPFDDSGGYSVTVRARDKAGKEGEWAVPLDCQVGTVQFSWPDSLVGEIQLDRDADYCLVTPDGNMLYVAHRGEDYVTPIRLADRAVLDTVEVGPGPYSLAATPDGRFVYITCIGDSILAVLRTADNTVVARVHVGPQPKGVAVTPDGAYVLVTVPFSEVLAIIRAQDNTLEDSVILGLQPSNVVVGDGGGLAYLTMATGHVVGKASIPQRALLDTIAVGQFPARIAASRDGNYLYVSNQTDSGLAVVRTSDFTVCAHIRMADQALGDVVVAPAGDYVLASYWNGIKCVAVPAFAVVDSAQHGKRAALAFFPSGDSLYVADGKRVFILATRR